MRKFLSALLISAAMTVSAGSPVGGVFNHLGAGVGVGTNGVSVELATPITSFIQMRVGVSVMPGITFNSDAEVEYTAYDGNRTGEVELKGDLGRVQGQVIFNVYPAPVVPFYVAVGAYFGGRDLVKITGHCDDLAGSNTGSVIIGDYAIPVDNNGNVEGGLKVKSFRPYVGIGWGRAIPGKFINYSMDLGVQFHGTAEVYTKNGKIDTSNVEDDNTFNKIIDKVKVYPTLTFRLGFRAF